MLKLDNADGWLDVEVGGKAVRLDLFRAHDRIHAAVRDVPAGDPDAYFDALTQAVSATTALPDLTAYAAEMVWRAVRGRVEEVEKKAPSPVASAS